MGFQDRENIFNEQKKSDDFTEYLEQLRKSNEQKMNVLALRIEEHENSLLSGLRKIDSFYPSIILENAHNYQLWLASVEAKREKQHFLSQILNESYEDFEERKRKSREEIREAKNGLVIQYQKIDSGKLLSSGRLECTKLIINSLIKYIVYSELNKLYNKIENYLFLDL